MSIAATWLFEDQEVDKKLAKLPNPIVIWEVARHIYELPPPSQNQVISAHPLDPLQFEIKPSVANLVKIPDQAVVDPRLLHLIQNTELSLRAEGAQFTNPQSQTIAHILARGQARFCINLCLAEDRTKLVKRLKPCRAGDSNHWQRTYGSDCFIQIRLSEQLLQRAQKAHNFQDGLSKAIWNFLNRPIIFAQRQYKAAVRKDVRAFLSLET